VIDTVPAGREVMNIAASTVPGLASTGPDVGGSNPNRGPATLALTVHGSNQNDQKLMQNGLEHNTNFAAWQQPTAIMMARTIRLGMQFDF
jgi:hypothetical protein